jgi:hypothetical protein
VDRGPTKHRSRMRPAPQGRAFRERRHFCHITILVSSDQQDGEAKAGSKPAARTVASKSAKRGGAAAAPRARKVAPKAPTAESSEKKSAAAKTESKGDQKADKAPSKPSKAAARKKTDD